MRCPPGWTCIDTGNSLMCVDCKDGDISFGKDFIFVFTVDDRVPNGVSTTWTYVGDTLNKGDTIQ